MQMVLMHNRRVFTEAIVGWLVQLLGDRTLRIVSKNVLGQPERRELAKAMDAAIETFVAALPDDRREHVARTLVERFDTPPLVMGPPRESFRETLIENVREQLRPLAEAEITGTGQSYFDQVGLDSNWALESFPHLFVQAIQRAATVRPSLAPLAAQLNADVVLAEVRALRAMGAHGPADTPTGKDVLALTSALEAVPALADEGGRISVIGQLRADISATVRHDARARLHLLNLVRTCDDHAGGVQELIDVLTFVEGDSLPMRRVREIAAPWITEDV
jgi:hypothetical protein